MPQVELEISGKRGIAAFKFRGMTGDHAYTHFEDKPTFDEVDVLANRYLDEFITGKLDRLDVAYTQFESIEPAERRGRNAAAAGLACDARHSENRRGEADKKPANRSTNFCRRPKAFWKKSCRPASRSSCSSASSTAAVSEQIARMVAMKAATENADKLIKALDA